MEEQLTARPGKVVDRVEVGPGGAAPPHIGVDGGSEVRLAGARPTDQHDVVPVRNKLAAVQRAQQSLIDWGAVEDESVEVLHRRQLGG